MALGLKQLAENIANTIEGFGSLFGGNKERGIPAHAQDEPTVKKILSKVEPTNWAKSLPYAFGVVEDPNVGGPQAVFASLQNGIFSDFTLPINPQELTQDENFAISIKPTQGGTVVQHSGNRYKDLTITGTTGVHPTRGDSGALQSTGQSILQPNKLRYKSGYEVFQHLRNWFRAYYEIKKNPQARALRLVFKNFKDGEFLIIELLKFNLKRSSAKPFMYEYTIQCRVLGQIEFDAGPSNLDILEKTDQIFNQALEYIDIARGAFLRSQSILRQLESNADQILNEPLRRVALALKAVVGTGNFAADMGPQLFSKFNSEKTALAVLLEIKETQDTEQNTGNLDPRLAQISLPKSIVGIDNLAKTEGLNFLLNQQNDSIMAVSIDNFPPEAIAELQANQDNAAEQPRSFFVATKETLIRIRDNAADRFGLGSTTYNEQFARTTTFSAEPGKVVTDEEFQVLNGFNSAIRGLNLMLSTPRLFKSPYEERIENLEDQFEDDLGLKAEPAIKEIVLPTNTDLETMALNYLGNASRWPEIAELNNLKPPYILQDRSDPTEAVVHPGDKLRIPQPIVNGFSNVNTVQVLPINENLSEAEKSLGIDLKLTRDFDIELTNTSDFQLISGAENAAQAIILKLRYERGDLFKHPEVGVGLNVGTKVPSVTEFQSALIDALLKDPRFESIRNLQIIRRNETVRLTMEVKIRNIDVPVPLDLKL